ncbi:MAG: ATP-binding protein [Ferruginibacter sp.]
MRYSLTFAFALSLFTLTAQQHSLEKIWETDTIVAVPESVLFTPNNTTLFVSLIDGGSWDADSKGGIAKLGANGKDYDAVWITGLNAPKGMGMQGSRLYVADLNSVVVIDISAGKVEKKITIDSATGLNDITISDKGIVYVSDSRTGKIWSIEKDQPQLFLSGMTGLNGLKSIGDDLFIGKGKSFIKADAKKQLTDIANLPEGIDGIEPVGNGDFILTSWGGYIFYVTSSGKVETLLDTHMEKKKYGRYRL